MNTRPSRDAALMSPRRRASRMASSLCTSTSDRCGDQPSPVRIADDRDRARNARLSPDEAPPLQHLHHLIEGRSRHEKVPCDIRFSRRHAVSCDVSRDDVEMLPLTLARGPFSRVPDIEVSPHPLSSELP